jgi:hypothetical protein
MFLLEKLTGLLPVRLRPAAKAVYPLLTACGAAGVSWAVTGNLDMTEIRTAATGAALALITYVIPNRRV